jgi:6-phosphogluconolactonase
MGDYRAGIAPYYIAASRTAGIVCVTNEGSGDISVYSINSDGSLKPLADSPLKTGSDPTGVTIDGNFIYVANRVSNNISAFRLSPNLALQPLPGSPFAAELGPFGLACTPDPR